MRDFIDFIFEFIGSESLTDEEYDELVALELTQPPDYTKEYYDALKLTLEGRENVSGQQRKLKAFFITKGVDISASSVTAKSNIYIGDAL